MNFDMKAMLLTIIGLLIVSPAWSVDVDANAYDADMANLLQILEVETDLATKTKMNADFVPGMVTVLHGDELERLGYQNVWESLALVPGVHLSLSSVGTYKVTFRGIGGAFGAAKYKFLVDGMPTYSTMTGTSSAYHIDVAQVERIEIIRGPGSALHGGLAYAGVINVVMRKDQNRASIRYGSFNTLQATVTAAGQSIDQSLAWHVNLGTWQTDGGNPLTGPDSLWNPFNAPLNQAISQAPGFSNEQVESATLNAGVTYEGFSFQALYLDVKKADHFGFSSVLPSPDQAGFIDYQDLTLQAKQHIDMSDDTEIDVKLEYRSYDIGSHFLFAQPGFRPPAAGGLLVLPQGMIGNLNYGENKYTAGLNVLNRSLHEQALLFGMEYNKMTTRDIWQRANFDPANLIAGNQPEQTYTGVGNWLTPGISRQNIALYVQDEIELGSQTTLTLGVRHDQYDDVGSSTNPRIAVVYRWDDSHMFKAQFATAFRPPTFVEMYSQNNPAFNANANIKPEQSQNVELGYVYRTNDAVMRLTFYHMFLKDMIILDAGTIKTYQNIGQAQARGIEFESEVALNAMWKLKGNVSFNNTEDESTGAAIEGSVDWLANAVIDYQPMQDYTFSLWGRYVGERHRLPGDARADLGSDTTVDVSGHVENLGLQGIDVRAGVRNVFDHDVRYPSNEGAYAEDLPRAGRTWWMQASYEF